MEAASQKLASLSTPVSAIPEFIDSGRHGLLVTDAPDELASAIVRLANEPVVTAELAQAAYVRLTEEFLMHPGIARLSRKLTELIGPGS